MGDTDDFLAISDDFGGHSGNSHSTLNLPEYKSDVTEEEPVILHTKDNNSYSGLSHLENKLKTLNRYLNIVKKEYKQRYSLPNSPKRDSNSLSSKFQDSSYNSYAWIKSWKDPNF